MATAADVIDDFNYIFDDVDDTEALYLLQNADTHLRTQIKMSTQTVTNTSLVADTQEYAIDDDIMRVWSVRYIKSATEGDEIVLTATSVDELDLDPDTENWRGQAAGTPAQYFIDGGNLGLYPKPDTSTTSSYPQLSIETTEDVTLAAGSTITPTARNHQAWVYHMAYHAALSRDDPRTDRFERRMVQEEEALRRKIHGRTARKNPRLAPITVQRDTRRV